MPCGKLLMLGGKAIVRMTKSPVRTVREWGRLGETSDAWGYEGAGLFRVIVKTALVDLY